MTGTRIAALVMIPLAIVAGILGGHFWHVTHAPQAVAPQATAPHEAALLDRPAAAGSPPAPASQAASSSSASPAPQVASRDLAPTIGSLPKIDASKSPAPDGKSPSFDIVRVEPKGDAVVAGKGAPNAQVALLSGGKVVGEAKSDANGQFVILPERLAPGAHALTLRQTPAGERASESKQSVAVSVPQPGRDKSKVVVALAEPGKATKLLSPPPGAADGAGAPAGKVIIRSAELENGNGIYVSGAASAGTSVHVYLNDSHIADVVAGADGGWSVRVKHGLTSGHYSVRADAAGGGGKIASRAEVPFDVPVPMAQAGKPPVAAPSVVAAATPDAAAPAAGAAKPGTPQNGTIQAVPVASNTATADAGTAAAPSAATQKSADAIVDSIATARVTTGDNLWNISRFRLGDGLRYTQIYAANSDQIRDPNLIYPGQIFVVPTNR